MAAWDKSETALIAATSSAKAATFESGIKEVHIIASADSYISFDEDVATTSSFLIKAGVEAQPFRFDGGGPLKIWAITATTANVYILIIR